MLPNVKGSEQIAVIGSINPSSQAAGTATSGWISMADFHRALAIISVGAFGASATVDANLQQAQDGGGTGAKVIGSGKAITQLVAAGGNNRQAEINLADQDLDVANGFAYVELSVVVGTAATETSAVLLGCVPRFAPASDNDAASVAQIV